MAFKKVVDEILEWRGFGRTARGLQENGDWCSRCRLRIFVRGEERIVVFSEARDPKSPYSNPGTSISNAIENLATMVAQKYDLAPQKTTWIEHYLAGKFYPEELHFVFFVWWDKTAFNPQWKPVGKKREELLALLSDR